MGEYANQPVTTGSAVQQSGGGSPGVAPGQGGGSSAHPGTGTGTEPAPTQPQAGGGGSQADQEKEYDWLFTHADGTPLTPAELRQEADDTAAYADGMQNNLDRASQGETDSEYLSDRQRSVDGFRAQADAMRAEAERIESQGGSASSTPEGTGGPQPQVPQRELPSGSITNPDGTTTELERLGDRTFRETRVDGDGNVLSTRTVERLPGDWARRE